MKEVGKRVSNEIGSQYDHNLVFFVFFKLFQVGLVLSNQQQKHGNYSYSLQ